ncbi:ribosomal protein 60S [Pyrolobus fumarii 1A]|uniref:Large ribosomal subunit protein P1 n=1 Tax=Pyrolobus fumarii (strain DSM 11204 / 1A) TaxID=694429 RepID=G0EDK8_PYRF1|nr:50S ribosomal protein P1 [Pyrolobus fumarii]AEM39812.1 ribosomal protein 60S [Pyrolobus fumarii 1A]
MEYIYASLLLHAMGKEISEENLKKIFEALGVQPDEVRIKAVVAALKEINIDEVIKTATAMPVAPAAAPAAAAPAAAAEEKKEEEKKEEEEEKKEGVSEEELAGGLESLFGF